MAGKGYRISIQSIGHGNAVEWIEDLTAPTRKGARMKATKWLQSEMMSDEKQLRFSVNDYEGSEVWQLI